MAVDYDLVIIGATKVGLDLAIKAAQKNARIAWICASELGYYDLELIKNSGHWFDYCQKVGVDLVTTAGVFINPHTFALPDRQLKSRTFAIALPQPQPHRAILGVEAQFLKHELLHQAQNLPRSLVLIGNDSFSCAIAQRLAEQGKEITLLVDSNHILPSYELELARYLQAQMEANGIRIYTSTQVNAIESFNSVQSDSQLDVQDNSDSKFKYRIWINNDQLQNQFFDCEALFLPNQIPIYQNLQLAIARVAQKEGRVLLNQCLQTSNHRIYWCESDADLEITLANTLYFPLNTKRLIFQVSNTKPQLVCLGMTEIEARLKYGTDLVNLTLPLNDGIAKLLCRQNGQIVAIHSMGMEARQITETAAIAISKQLKIQDLPQNIGIISDFAEQFASFQKRRKVATLTSDLGWHWFNFRRNWDL